GGSLIRSCGPPDRGQPLCTGVWRLSGRQAGDRRQFPDKGLSGAEVMRRPLLWSLRKSLPWLLTPSLCLVLFSLTHIHPCPCTHTLSFSFFVPNTHRDTHTHTHTHTHRDTHTHDIER